jgi:hypothetical protein
MLTDAEQTELVEIDERQIEYIMGAFDFDKLREVMELLRWEYWYPPDEGAPLPGGYKKVPTAAKLRQVARELLTYATHAGEVYGGGGFRAGRTEEGALYLQFIAFDVSADEDINWPLYDFEYLPSPTRTGEAE